MKLKFFGFIGFAFAAVLSWQNLFAQPDSVDVTFYYKPAGNPSVVYLPGEFNNWQLSAISRMTKELSTGIWFKTVRLRVGGPVPLPVPGKSIAGAYQYKFNEDGSRWLPDPLNPRQNPRDNNNSYLFINNPTIHYLLPNSLSPLIKTSRPEITAYIFPAVSSTVEVDSIELVIDAQTFANIGAGYNPATHFFSFVPPVPLANGSRSLKLFAQSSKGTAGADSTSFIVQAGFVQLLTRPNQRHLRPNKTIVGTVEDPAVGNVTLFHNNDSTVLNVDASGQFSLTLNLAEGNNTFKAQAKDQQGGMHQTETIAINYVVNHAPKPEIQIALDQGNVIFTANGNDPDGDLLTYAWAADDRINPEPLNIVSTEAGVSVPIPITPGEYFIDLLVADPGLNEGTTRNYFTVSKNGSVTIPTINSNPQWIKDAVVYEIFVPAFTAEGTFQAAKLRLPIIKSLGANVVWLMPIYENGETINELNAGYNVIDFFKVHPQLGTMADFQSFLQEAHRLGIRVILDSTPNHVSAFHPWVKDVQIFRDFSNFRPFLESEILGDNRGLGQSSTTVGGYVLYVHYSDWSLANIDYSNIEAVDDMLNMYKYWVLEQGVDGYRMDVYWGPHNRYGKNAWWRPFREEIKRVRPEVLILGETDGTGPSSENNYADGGGASDAAYDWNFYGEIKSTLNGGSLDNLDNRVRNFSPNLNYNHFTGPNAHYLRFLENHDETRIAQLFSLDRTRAGAALLLTIPGMPLIYSGQEVGETSRRGKINWNRPGAQNTFAFYQRLAAIRNTFSTFRSPEIKRIASSPSRVYAYLRPQTDQNGFGVVNFSNTVVTATLSINQSDLRLSLDSLRTGVTYYLNDVLNDTAYAVTKSTIGNFQIKLPAWGAATLVLADTLIRFVTSVKTPDLANLPARFRLDQNYPNPFNPETAIRFELPRQADVTLRVFNLLGEEVITLVREKMAAGTHTLIWNGRNAFGELAGSGIYLLRLEAGNEVAIKKMVLVR
jgi:glycosidase